MNFNFYVEIFLHSEALLIFNQADGGIYGKVASIYGEFSEHTKSNPIYKQMFFLTLPMNSLYIAAFCRRKNKT